MREPRDFFLRSLGLAVLGTLLIAAQLRAQDASTAPPQPLLERRFQLFAGFEPSFMYSDVDGFEYEGGAQIGMGYFWTSKISSELSYTRRDGDFSEANVVDATALYHFPSASRWKFFAGTGFHYARVTEATLLPPIPLSGPFVRGGDAARDVPTVDRVTDGTGWLVTGGLNYQFSSNYSLRMDARYVPLEISGTLADTDFASTLGVGIKF